MLIVTVVLRGSPVAMLLLGAATLQVGYGAIATGVAAAGTGVVLSLVVVRLPRLADLARSAPALAEREARRSAIPVSSSPPLSGSPPRCSPARRSRSRSARVRRRPRCGRAGARVPPLAAAVGLAGQLAAFACAPS